MSTNLGNLTTGVVDSYYHCFLGEQRFQGYIDTLGLSSGDPDSGYWATNYIKRGHQIASHRREMESVDTKTEGKTNDASAGWDSGKESKVIITNWWYQKKINCMTDIDNRSTPRMRESQINHSTRCLCLHCLCSLLPHVLHSRSQL